MKHNFSCWIDLLSGKVNKAHLMFSRPLCGVSNRCLYQEINNNVQINLILSLSIIGFLSRFIDRRSFEVNATVKWLLLTVEVLIYKMHSCDFKLVDNLCGLYLIDLNSIFCLFSLVLDYYVIYKFE